MNNYRITIQYDGTRYRGWQSQNSTDETIQGKITEVLSRMSGEDVAVIGSGRTDAGVHARGQVANFYLSNAWDVEEMQDYLNRYLPEDIAVTQAEKADERFHSRYQAKSKTYLYRIHTGRIPEVFERKYVYDYQAPLCAERMKKAAELLIGTHDFRSFCGNKKMKKSTVRTIYDICIEESEQELRIFYTGDGFLQNMVRILTGTLIEIGDGRREPEEITEILEAKDRERAGYTAPACGLTLLEVVYEDRREWKNG
ncbi:MAG: tRNA pseudouridine(38-40) synthase TruA [Clostridiales bacterium]|nr:tRNA pseudouridine(38-40) synthase TruA [Roseburia sp.]MDD7638175.1 tRNA pseudouridine(38-40) synthase TruA [Clostridiales bacterium]MDY4113657.1 tRNA pseudouridine(38-40) synthase TruA [Roseburia sp.]